MYLKMTFTLICLLFTFISAKIGTARVYIDIEAPELKPFPIAIADFKDVGRSQADLGPQIMKILSNDLTISGFFEIIPKSEFPEEIEAITETPDYESWLTNRAEALVMGGYSASGGQFAIEFRLFDLVDKAFLSGKRYKGKYRELQGHQFTASPMRLRI